ncbi:MAG: CUB domain-containing protein [Chitinophagales bacterium]|nr:CUB domain-containing protein [Chitinophagales bacterium]MDW8428405.1 CUB domain-containing protein [Chitinophagales bacterium]
MSCSWAQSTFWLKPATVTINCPSVVYFYDNQVDTTGPGGLGCGAVSSRNYQDVTDVTVTFNTSNGSCIRDSLILPFLNTTICSGDTLYIYDGASTSAPLIRKMSAGANTTNFTTLGPSLTFRFKADQSSNARGWQMLLRCTPCVSAPLNDDCLNATPLVSGATCQYTPGFINHPTNPTATVPACSGIPNGNDDVWYRFTAAATIDTIRVQSVFPMDAVVQLFSGNCSALNLLQCVNNTGGGGVETLVATGLTVGQTYYIRVFDFNGGGGTATYNFNICVIARSPTDCAGAIQLCTTTPYTGSCKAGDFGIQEYSPATFGCMIFGEHSTNWLFWQMGSNGTLGFNIHSSNGSPQDIDFALWGPLSGLHCPMSSPPIRCSIATQYATNSYGQPPYSTGLQAAETDVSEPPTGNAFVDTVNVKAGQYYVLLIDVWSGNMNYVFQFQLSNGATINPCVLPVELISFRGEVLPWANQLYWVTLSEYHVAEFVVERSTDGHSFEAIDLVAAAGTSTSMKSYTYTDTDPPAGHAYYRLNIRDADGSQQYSHVVHLERYSKSQLKVSPNPTLGPFSVEIPCAQPTLVQMELCNSLGQQLFQHEVLLDAGKHLLSYDLTGFAPGVYYVRATGLWPGHSFSAPILVR